MFKQHVFFSILLCLQSCHIKKAEIELKRKNYQLSTVDILNTQPKHQVVGNCWIYASIASIEAMLASTSNNVHFFNLSESYLTYRYFQEQLMNPAGTNEVTSGGKIYQAMRLLEKYGVINEDDFIPNSSVSISSPIQAYAEKTINDSLQNGSLIKIRRQYLPEKEKSLLIKQELDKIFGIKIDEIEQKVIKAEDLIVMNKNGKILTLKNLVDKKSEYYLKEIYFPTNSNKEAIFFPSLSFEKSQIDLLRKVFRAMNDGFPIMITWFVDENALIDGTFSLAQLKEKGPGMQGNHVTVLEDYVVRGINPETGQEFFIGEGNSSEQNKQLAINYGYLEYFITKNSWGQNKNNTYFRDGNYGYHKLNSDYLFSFLKKTENTLFSNLSSMYFHK